MVVRKIAIGLQIKRHFVFLATDQQRLSRPQRMPYSQFIKDVGIMNGYVGYHKITGKQQLKHILAYVSGLYDNARSISFYSGLFQCRYNQLLMDPIKIYFVLYAKGPDYKCIHSLSLYK